MATRGQLHKGFLLPTHLTRPSATSGTSSDNHPLHCWHAAGSGWRGLYLPGHVCVYKCYTHAQWCGGKQMFGSNKTDDLGCAQTGFIPLLAKSLEGSRCECSVKDLDRGDQGDIGELAKECRPPCEWYPPGYFPREVILLMLQSSQPLQALTRWELAPSPVPPSWDPRSPALPGTLQAPPLTPAPLL